jgi:hypothetical protein
MNGDVRDDGKRELGWPGRLFLSMWSGGLDICEPPEDTRATSGGDTPSVVERAAVADGNRFCEVQRELRGSKPESRGTEIDKFTTWGVAPKTMDEDYWGLFVEAFVLHSPVIDHGHHAGKWLSTGRVHWAPVPSKSLGWGFSSCITRHGSVKMMVGRCGRHRILLWRPKRIGNWLAGCIRESIQGVFGPGSRRMGGATRHMASQRSAI